MFTRFLAPQRPRTGPLAGTLVSLTAHAAVVVAAVGGDLSDPAGTDSDAPPPSPPAAPTTPGGERVHWAGAGSGTTAGSSPRPGARPPVAYVIPGRGPAREGTPGPEGPRRRMPGADEPPAAALRRRPAPRALQFNLPLPAPPEIDVTLLVAGVVSSAPDLARRVSRPDDFVHLPVAELLADLRGATAVHTPDGLRPVGYVDELPVALVSNPLPPYPAVLARARVGGRVVVEFTIDSVGVVAPGSFRVVESTDALFTQAVRAVVPRLRFLPAQLGAHAIGVTVRQPFVFAVRPGA